MRFARVMCVLGIAAGLSSACAVKRPASPTLSTPIPSTRVFELRTYTTYEGRLEALLTRFRDHTTRLFEKHGMTNVGYWIPQDTARAKNTLIYVLAHESREAARRSWEGFRNDPVWHQARDASEASGRIVVRVESVYMSPTDFSMMR
jgi:hypothetical protein